MRYTQLLLSLFLLFTFVIALPAPAPVEAVAAQDAADKNKNKNNNNNGNKGTKTKTNNNGNTNKGQTTKATKNGTGGNTRPTADECAAAKKLATGIDKNISIQKQEQKDVAAVKKAVQSGNKGQFDQAKTKLVATVKSGADVRAENQKIAPKGNAAIPGLKKVQNAQATELKQAQGLTGGNADLDTIAQMEKEFSGGIDQNQQNKKDALKGC
ncbi:hypothetical protein HER10_EVM0012759 [Colletotrichum scovillei]|uniref:Small secreted protein n=1 Tax=Colletotrichum scovillei TaxID=1209932 RepID=A0A9P7UCJ5_9PEZI|nr:uncharacterized protein HER10_EVM0012759 [Colletotrichum scovillei]KAF4782478.1 hypothetical protein HER10_EVM0012759 [Colletotrichum scovillei]KAG7050136.1 hypothetical protein JMJ77_0012889 [Colletotrichum scovillei]KAG7069175.1 hypothetical protein JMJ76_0002850 [Colletotrichum scovillei]KAG7073126.1 hypothetical protein JMJ78_0014106 [Colletotrichum scovillei]